MILVKEQPTRKSDLNTKEEEIRVWEMLINIIRLIDL